ncbi:DgyrCDS11553 [Dimorphilus gyrociliatus]|uniref:DgyrCDS11553 n=1 Tax=Dimorphilus gyrociliatus TaxID=2664684 RepID=A0A7I8W5J7_9ANNE|nr:DgyrCDS11553 [Dimorphilus gyrociliatus]
MADTERLRVCRSDEEKRSRTLPSDDEKLVIEFRSAMEATKLRMGELRDALHDQQKNIGDSRDHSFGDKRRDNTLDNLTNIQQYKDYIRNKSYSDDKKIESPAGRNLSNEAKTHRGSENGRIKDSLLEEDKRLEPLLERANVEKEQRRQISILTYELNIGRDLNEQLQKRLADCEKELISLRVDGETKEKQIRAEAARQLTDLVQEVHEAQKQRDEAVEQRIKTAKLVETSEPEKAARTKRIIHLNDVEDMDINEILTKFSEISDIGENGNALSDVIARTARRRRSQNAQQLKLALKERDEALRKCRKLEADLRLRGDSNIQHLKVL